MTARTLHSYEPRKGHGLPHDPFNAIVGPRPGGTKRLDYRPAPRAIECPRGGALG